MDSKSFSKQIGSLSSTQWRILRLAAWSAVLAQAMVLFYNKIPALKIYDFLLMVCYLVVVSIFMHGARKEAKAGAEADKAPSSFGTAQRRCFRFLVLLSIGLFAFGAWTDRALLFSSGMVSLAFLAVFLWVITVEPSEQRPEPVEA